MKIVDVTFNNRKRTFEVETAGTGTLPFPYAKLDPAPAPGDRAVLVEVDPELGREGFVYAFQSGLEGAVHADAVLDYNREPSYMKELLLHKLTLEARRRVSESPLARRELIRRMKTSATQFYRLLDPANARKSVDQLLKLLAVLGCAVDLVVDGRRA